MIILIINLNKKSIVPKIISKISLIVKYFQLKCKYLKWALNYNLKIKIKIKFLIYSNLANQIFNTLDIFYVNLFKSIKKNI